MQAPITLRSTHYTGDSQTVAWSPPREQNTANFARAALLSLPRNREHGCVRKGRVRAVFDDDARAAGAWRWARAAAGCDGGCRLSRGLLAQRNSRPGADRRRSRRTAAGGQRYSAALAA